MIVVRQRYFFKALLILGLVFGFDIFSVEPIHARTPADRVKRPRPEKCIPFEADPEEGEFSFPDGLSYSQVTSSLNKVIQKALYCDQPKGFSKLNLTFELNVGCNGLVSKLEVVDDDGAPESYVKCVSSVIKKADFPAHDKADGQIITYPVNVAW